MTDKPNHLSTVQKQLLKVFPYWSPERYETLRKKKMEPGSNSFCGSLFRFVREPKRRRKESPFGGLVVVDEWDVWDFSKMEVEDSDQVLKELVASPIWEKFVCGSFKQVAANEKEEESNEIVGNEELSGVDSNNSGKPDSEDVELLEAVEVRVSFSFFIQYNFCLVEICQKL